MADRTKIEARTIVGFQDGEHRILENGCVVVEGNEIIHVGKDFDGQVDLTVDARDRVVTPGFINTHSHLAGSPLDKSFIEDRGRRQFSMSGLPEMLPARSAAMDREGLEACVDYSMGELLRTGTTTVMEIGGIEITPLTPLRRPDYVPTSPTDIAQAAGSRATEKQWSMTGTSKPG